MNKGPTQRRDLVVILVHWLIREGSEQAFKDFWRNIMKIPKGKGLYREMLTEPAPSLNPKYATFSITDKSYSTFINIGLWRSLADFDEAVASYIPPATDAVVTESGRTQRTITLEEFEFKFRERIVLNIIHDRDGGLLLPDTEL